MIISKLYQDNLKFFEKYILKDTFCYLKMFPNKSFALVLGYFRTEIVIHVNRNTGIIRNSHMFTIVEAIHHLLKVVFSECVIGQKSF